MEVGWCDHSHIQNQRRPAEVSGAKSLGGVGVVILSETGLLDALVALSDDGIGQFRVTVASERVG